jgi:hypothetical protein
MAFLHVKFNNFVKPTENRSTKAPPIPTKAVVFIYY